MRKIIPVVVPWRGGLGKGGGRIVGAHESSHFFKSREREERRELLDILLLPGSDGQ